MIVEAVEVCFMTTTPAFLFLNFFDISLFTLADLREYFPVIMAVNDRSPFTMKKLPNRKRIVIIGDSQSLEFSASRVDIKINHLTVLLSCVDSAATLEQCPFWKKSALD